MKKLIKTFSAILLFASFSSCSFGQKLDRDDLAKKIVTSLQQSDVKTLLKLVPSLSEYENAITVQRSFSKIKFRKTAKEEAKFVQADEQKNIQGRYEDLMGEYGRGTKNPKWNSTQISRIIYATEKDTGNSYSAILVELIDSADNQKYYLEIESVLTKSGWKIFDDIMIVEDKIEKRIETQNKRQI